MRRGIRICLVVAAALSVVSIPVVVLIVSHNQSAAWTDVSIILAAVGVLVSWLFTTVTYWKTSSKLDRHDSLYTPEFYRPDVTCSLHGLHSHHRLDLLYLVVPDWVIPDWLYKVIPDWLYRFFGYSQPNPGKRNQDMYT